jgi:putative protein-disulfide isomerase
MTAPHLIYFADPMCSWCWGFAPVIAQAQARYGESLPTRLILGGLRPGTTTPMSRAQREDLAVHWAHVNEASGQAFNAEAFLDRDGFVYDTDPACRAVVCARRQDASLALPYLHAAQRAFYAEGRDVTDAEVLTALAADLDLDGAQFANDLADESVGQETWGDYATSQNAGVRGFPTLIIGPNADGTYAPISRGYNAPDAVLGAIASWIAAR